MSSSNKKYDIYSHNIVGSKLPSQRVKRAMSTRKLTPSHPQQLFQTRVQLLCDLTVNLRINHKFPISALLPLQIRKHVVNTVKIFPVHDNLKGRLGRFISQYFFLTQKH